MCMCRNWLEPTPQGYGCRGRHARPQGRRMRPAERPSCCAFPAVAWLRGSALPSMIWMWMSSIVVLLGAELNSEVEHQTIRKRPIGERRAAMADTVGRSSGTNGEGHPPANS